jgi:hypothetical protein
MNDPIPEHHWDVRAAYRKGWEERMAYYDRLLRSIMELIEGGVRIMKVDGLSEAIEDLEQALLVIENAWATVSWEWTSMLSAKKQSKQMETEGDIERGASKKIYLR